MSERTPPSNNELQNDRILRAARGEAVDCTPVWAMRQAGRYLPEYRAVREKHSFFEVVQTPDLAAEVTLQPIERFDLDAAIIFSDILVIPQAMGFEVEMVPGKGPHFPAPLESVSHLSRVVDPDIDDTLGHVFDAVRVTRERLEGRVPLIGFAGAPWTLMAYMIEGGGSKSFREARAWLYRHPDETHELLTKITDVIIEYLSGKIEAGAQLLQVFDSWAGLLGPREFSAFEKPQLERIARELKERYPDIPLIVFAKSAPYALEELSQMEYDVISLDWTMDPQDARRRVGEEVVLQGNLDPAALYAPPREIRRITADMIEAFGRSRHIANLGHGMHPDHDPMHLNAFVDAVHESSRA